MSFILDALKKSENERQRHSGPALFEVKVATRRPGLPLWAIALAALLVVNIAVVIWLVLRKPAPEAQPVAAAMAAIPPPTPAAITAPPPAPAATLQQPSAVEPQTPGVGAPAQSAPIVPSDDDAEPLNPDDYEPAAEPSAGAPPPTQASGSVTRGTVEGLPTYDQIAAGGSIPEIRLDLHVYSAKPQDRFVFLNMQRLHEGESLPNGVHVEKITPEGVVLSHRGAKFVLERE